MSRLQPSSQRRSQHRARTRSTAWTPGRAANSAPWGAAGSPLVVRDGRDPHFDQPGDMQVTASRTRSGPVAVDSSAIRRTDNTLALSARPAVLINYHGSRVVRVSAGNSAAVPRPVAAYRVDAQAGRGERAAAEIPDVPHGERRITAQAHAGAPRTAARP